MKIFAQLFSTFIACLALTNLAAVTATAQTTTLQDATAATLLRSSLLAMTSGAALSDINFQITGAQSVGPDTVGGSGTFYGRLDGNTRLDFDSGSGPESECHLLGNGQRSIVRRNAEGKVSRGALHAAWVSNIWMAPPLAISRVLHDAEYKLLYKGRDYWNGRSVEHVTVFLDVITEDAESRSLIAKLSTVELFLDSVTFLPVRTTYSLYSDKSYSDSFPIELDYSDFAAASGVALPRKITALFNFGPWRLYQVSEFKLNSGIPDSTFELAGGTR